MMPISKPQFSQLPDDQPPATSYPDPQKREQMPPMNPTPDVPGTDAPEVTPPNKTKPVKPNDEE